jgi:hypothetical protein
MLDAAPDGISARGQATLKRAEAMTPDDYRTNLLARQQAQLAHMATASTGLARWFSENLKRVAISA